MLRPKLTSRVTHSYVIAASGRSFINPVCVLAPFINQASSLTLLTLHCTICSLNLVLSCSAALFLVCVLHFVAHSKAPTFGNSLKFTLFFRRH